MDPLVSNNIFHFTKKNRVIQNVFKVRNPSEVPSSQRASAPRGPENFLKLPENQLLCVPLPEDDRKPNSSHYLTPSDKVGHCSLISASCPTSSEAISFEAGNNTLGPGVNGGYQSGQRRKESERSFQKREEVNQKKKLTVPDVPVNEFHNEPVNLDHESEGATTTSLHLKVMNKISFIKKPKDEGSKGSPKKKIKLTVNTGPRYGYRGEESSDGSPCSAGVKKVSRIPLCLVL